MKQAINIRQIEREANIPIRTIPQVIKGLRRLPKHHEPNLKAVLSKYGIKRTNELYKKIFQKD